jgi:HD superfamily phosphohydrolase
MRYEDPIYGPTEFAAPVILDLLGSKALQRLRGVLQHGIAAELTMPHPITRYEHSIGTMILVRRLGGSVAEQVAALIHDVSHTAFSHVIDFVFDTHGDQAYHEKMKEGWLRGSDLPEVLHHHGLDVAAFLSDERFPLLEQPPPCLCADRLDCFLRDACEMGILTTADVANVCRHLTVAGQRIAVDELAIARFFAYRYITADEGSWSNPARTVLYHLTAQAIRTGLQRRAIGEEDIWGEDVPLWDRLRASADPQVAGAVARVLRPPRFVVDEVAPTIRLYPKVRTIDPDVVTDHGVRPLSEQDSAFRQFREKYLARKASGISIRLEE